MSSLISYSECCRVKKIQREDYRLVMSSYRAVTISEAGGSSNSRLDQTKDDDTWVFIMEIVLQCAMAVKRRLELTCRREQ